MVADIHARCFATSRAFRDGKSQFAGVDVDEVTQQLSVWGCSRGGPLVSEITAKMLTGAAGFGFVEDPFGFRTGSLAKESPRLVLEISFGVSEKLCTGAFMGSRWYTD
ncbi:hypothetical protein AB8Z38_15885 [Bradyrhizobium sp. LLZ17]|uniref:Uncharacterized protein n=1 Tax=Bradyrhizobium sp. LLZ17 TaxID=3239388 RepID=A0AB39XW69_9BRAD